MKTKYLIISLIALLFFLVVFLLSNLFLQINHTREVNKNIMQIIALVKEHYPETPMEELLSILNNENIDAKDLNHFGISINDIYMLESTRDAQNLIFMVNAGLIIIFGVSHIIILSHYMKTRKIKTNEITNYIKEISKRNYALKLEENNEGELSNLQNELYKIMILLKEQSETAISDKKSIKASVSDISHQLKTPLTSILIGIDNLIDNPNMKPNIKEEFLKDIRKQTENINFLITSILKLSRFDANVIKFEKEQINVKKFLIEVVKTLNTIAKKKNITISIKGENDVTFIGDYKWELEAVTNIVKNSIEHIDKDGKIFISYRKLSIYTEITIEDNGKGIDSKDLKHIFERFYKGKNSSKDSIGIGLSLAKRIIENDDGYINVKSELEKGTIFAIKFMRK